MTATQVTLVVVLCTCILASGFFSGSETAFVALPRERVHRLAERGHRGRRLAALVDDLERTIGVLLVANNFVNILAASLATILAVEFLAAVVDPGRAEALGPWLATLVLTAVILLIGEITPKTLAARRPDGWGLAVAPAIWWLSKLLTPIATVFTGLAGRLLRLFGIQPGLVTAATEEDIRALAMLSAEAGEIEPEEREILESLFRLADRPVRDVMTPRLDVVSLEAPVSETTVRSAATAHRHSRFPVVAAGGTLDDIVGILYVKDIITDGGAAGVKLREPFYVPERSSILTAIQRMRRQRQGFAVVLDEHGGVDGIVTVKDLVAELVGDLQDEHDPIQPSIVRLADSSWVVEGAVPVEDLEDAIGLLLPEGPYSSVGGLFLATTGSIPEMGDTAEVGGVRLEVLRMDRRRIDRLRVDVSRDGTGTPASG
ncbi:MAG: hemolysin family protein [Acidimicrobiia bacterium]|jgi:putative hemolysin